MRVLVACEFSGRVRDAFLAKGHDAWSSDVISGEPESGRHILGDCVKLDDESWDLVIAHPPCTYLCVSGSRWWKDRIELQNEAVKFVLRIWKFKAKRIAIENPIGHLSRYQKPDQIIQPWMFGHGETKATCLWLKNLPKLNPTNIVDGRDNRIHKLGPSKDRSKLRSITYQGIANAMADQWGCL